MNKGILSTFGVVLAVALFFAANFLAGTVFGNTRADLTEEKVFTLSDGARNIAQKVPDQITLRLYFSENEVSKDDPQLRDFGRRVRDLLLEFQRASGGKIKVVDIDPDPFSPEEDDATRAGLKPFPLASGDPFFLGVEGTNTLDDHQVLPYIDAQSPVAERYLEYDVARLVYQLSHPEHKKVGVLSTLPLEGGGGNPMLGQQQTQPRWQILAQLGQFFDLETVQPDAKEIPADVDVLMVVHPRNLSAPTKYAIDQFVVGGKPAMFFVDPQCEADQSGQDPSNPLAGMFGDKSSNLNDLFRPWGFEVVADKVVGDRENCARVRNNSRQAGALQTVDYVTWLMLRDKSMDQSDAVTSSLQMVFLPSAGAIQPVQAATTELEPLIQTGEDSMLIDVGKVQGFPQPEDLLKSFVSEHRRFTVAARVTGKAKSAFPDGPPADTTKKDDAQKADDAGADDASKDADAKKDTPAPVAEGEIHVIVVSDADCLADRNWIQPQSFLGQTIGWHKITDNGDLTINAIEGLAGGKDLALLRVRGRFHRPFEKFEAMQRDAEQKYLDEQNRLEASLKEIQDNINRLQKEKSADQQLILSPEQEAELEKAQQSQADTRAQLRVVKHNLRRDIEALQGRIKAVDMAGVPALVLILAIAVGYIRSHRRG